MNQSFPDLIIDADAKMREVYNALLKMLYQDDLDYLIEFKGKTYDFCKPLDKNEKKVMDAQKRKLARVFMRDALQKLGKTIECEVDANDAENGNWEMVRRVWCNLANMQRSKPKVETVSTIVSQESYDAGEGGTPRDLDWESPYIQAQRQDLSDEEKWKLLLQGMSDRESVISDEVPDVSN